MKKVRVENMTLKNPLGIEVMYPEDGVLKPMSLQKATEFIVFGFPDERPSVEDSIHATQIFDAFKDLHDGIAYLDDEAHAWLEARIRSHAPKIQGIDWAIASFLTAAKPL